MIGRLSASATGHILANDGRISGSVFLHEGYHRSYAHISRAARVAALNDGYGLALIVRSLRKELTRGERKAGQKNDKKPPWSKSKTRFF